MTSQTTTAVDQLADFTQDKRVILLSAMALLVGGISALVAKGLAWLIAVISNASYYGIFSSTLQSPAKNSLGYLAILVPVVGGLAIGIMAKFGSEQIR